MLKQGGKEVKEHDQSIEFPKVCGLFRKKNHTFPVILLMKLFLDSLWTVLQRRQNSEGSAPGKESLSPTKTGDHSGNSVRLPQQEVKAN